MSLHVESPLSDSKMDISEATTSLDSAGVSPIAEDDVAEATKTQPLSPSPTNHNDHHDNIKAPPERQNEDDVDMDTGKTTAAEVCNSHLDNRKMRPEVLALEVPFAQRQHIARTLANSHPLMSPSDSESEQLYGVTPASAAAPSTTADDLKCHNFPDVVPQYEHIQPPLPSNAVKVNMRNTLNTIRGKGVVAVPTHSKLTLLRAHSPDLLSSESEADVSQYAAVEANFQAVALMPSSNSSAGREARRIVRKVAAGAGSLPTGCDDISSLDSISNHSFDDDEDLEHNLASLSPSSSLIDGLDDDDSDDAPGAHDEDDFAEATTPTPNARNGVPPLTEQLPQYSAAEERRDSRNWQKITLPDGHTREIDMRVIEPYKRVLSHGGYLKAGGHNAIVIFCACHLPDRSRTDYNYVMDNLFLYVVKTLEQLVTEDYVLIYLHGGTSRRNVPPFPWLKKCYQLLDRRLRKSLKNMYLVHPTFWIKSIVWMARPFVSAKFWRKLIYIKSLDQLGEHVTVEKAAIPEKVKQYDARHN